MKSIRFLFAIISIALIISSPAKAQSEPNCLAKPNSLYFEILGNGVFYSVNYDRLFTENIGARIGFTYLSSMQLLFFKLDEVTIIPATLNYFTGEYENKLELGAGISYVSTNRVSFLGMNDAFDSGTSGILGTLTIGYRYQQPEGGLMFRIGFTPLFSSRKFLPFLGGSIGTSF